MTGREESEALGENSSPGHGEAAPGDQTASTEAHVAGQARAQVDPASEPPAPDAAAPGAEPEQREDASPAAQAAGSSAHANGDAAQAEASAQAERPTGKSEQVGAVDSAEATVEPSRD